MAETSAKTLRAFEAAGIRPGQRRSERLARLTEGERELYRWVLRTFAQGRRPEVEELCDTASRLDVDVETAMARLAREDLVHQDPGSGEILVAYPFSGRPTPHRVRLAGAREVDAMCAVDALGMPFMLGADAEIVSRDPVAGVEVWVRIDPGDGVWWEPQTAVVFAGATGASGPSVSTCCSFINFFASAESAGRYLHEHPVLRGETLSIPEAVEAGRLIFGDLLEAST
jgi:hypothetical protein